MNASTPIVLLFIAMQSWKIKTVLLKVNKRKKRKGILKIAMGYYCVAPLGYFHPFQFSQLLFLSPGLVLSFPVYTEYTVV